MVMPFLKSLYNPFINPQGKNPTTYLDTTMGQYWPLQHFRLLRPKEEGRSRSYVPSAWGFLNETYLG